MNINYGCVLLCPGQSGLSETSGTSLVGTVLHNVFMSKYAFLQKRKKVLFHLLCNPQYIAFKGKYKSFKQIKHKHNNHVCESSFVRNVANIHTYGL